MGEKIPRGSILSTDKIGEYSCLLGVLSVKHAYSEIVCSSDTPTRLPC